MATAPPTLTKMVLVIAFKRFQMSQWLLSPPLTHPRLPESWDQRCSSPGHRFAYSSHQVLELRQNRFWITYQARKHESGFHCVHIATVFHSIQLQLGQQLLYAKGYSAQWSGLTWSGICPASAAAMSVPEMNKRKKKNVNVKTKQAIRLNLSSFTKIVNEQLA